MIPPFGGLGGLITEFFVLIFYEKAVYPLDGWILQADLDLDAQGKAHLAWIEQHFPWEGYGHLPLRATQIVSTTLPQISKHYYVNGQRIASRVDGDLYYTLSDHLGSTSLVVDTQGNEVGRVIYDAYGQIVSNTIPLTLTDRLFTGQIFDASTGLYYYNARYYDPLAGQFTQPDSVVADPLDPRAWNRFSYVYGNPVNFTDPSGHAIWDVTLDIVSFGLSLDDFERKPNLANGIWLALDTISLLPVIPSLGAVHHLGKLDEIGDAARGANAAGNFVQTANQVENGLNAANQIDNAADVVGALCSFSSDTSVTTPEGQAAISTLSSGDLVLAYDELLNTTGWYTVTAVWMHEDSFIVHLTLDDEIIETTPEHPFYTEAGEWLAAGELQIGTRIRRADGSYGTVQNIKVVLRPQWMYNLTVDQAHTFFVGQGRWLAHNDCFKILKPGDLGIEGDFKHFLVSWEVVDDKATLRLDYVEKQGKIGVTNPFKVLNNAYNLARSYGAKELRIQGVLINEDLKEILKNRYHFETIGIHEVLVIPLQ